MSELWNPQTERWNAMDRRDKYERQTRMLRAVNALADAEAKEKNPRGQARLVRRRLETLGDWDEVEDVVFLLLSRPAGEIDGTMEV
jgi:hypothetical protein